MVSKNPTLLLLFKQTHKNAVQQVGPRLENMEVYKTIKKHRKTEKMGDIIQKHQTHANKILENQAIYPKVKNGK